MRPLRLTFALALAVGALLVVAVAGASAATSCGDYSFKLTGATIKLAALKATAVSCNKARSLAKQCISATGPNAAWKSSQSGSTVTLRNGVKKVTFRTVNAKQTCVGSG
jgi:hypothetical protein